MSSTIISQFPIINKIVYQDSLLPADDYKYNGSNWRDCWLDVVTITELMGWNSNIPYLKTGWHNQAILPRSQKWPETRRLRTTRHCASFSNKSECSLDGWWCIWLQCSRVTWRILEGVATITDEFPGKWEGYSVT